MTSVSAVIPFYGNPADALNLVGQLKAQAETCEFDFEIIVSDDCSPVPFPITPGVKVVRRETNGGFGANVNTAVAQAVGQWIFILNSDLTLPDHFMKTAYSRARLLDNVLWSPQVLGNRGENQYVGRKFPTTAHIVWEWLTPFARFRDTRWWHRLVGHDTKCHSGVVREVDWVMGACMIVQRKTFNRLGGMDERFFMNSEEIDLQLRLKDKGIPRYFVGDLTVYHAGGASSGANETRRQWVLNSRFIYAKKWGVLKNLAVSLRVATYINLGVNMIRALRNPAVTPQETKEFELQLIDRAEKSVMP